jgi:hypothetical protein
MEHDRRARSRALPQVTKVDRPEPYPSVKPSALSRGAAPEPPALPRRWGMQTGSSPRPGRQSSTPEPPGAARAHFDRPAGQTLAAPGEPGVAQEVPDRGDDLDAVLAAQPKIGGSWSNSGSTRPPPPHRCITPLLAFVAEVGELPGPDNRRSYDGTAWTNSWPTHLARVPPRCPRTTINSQRWPPATTCEHEASGGFEPPEQRTRTRS